MSDELTGEMGRISVPVTPGRAGEVMMNVRGGTEAFTAYSRDGESLEKNCRCVVVEQLSARTVMVTSV